MVTGSDVFLLQGLQARVAELVSENAALELAVKNFTANNSASNKLCARLSQMEVIVRDGCRHKQELLNLINECTQLLA